MKTQSISLKNYKKVRNLSFVLVLINLLRLITKVSGQDSGMPDMNMDMSAGNSTSGHLILWLEGIIMFVFAISIIFYVQTQRKLGKSIISVPFLYLTFGVVLLIFARLFLVLNEFEVYDINLMTVRILWHLFIYLSMITFLISIEKVGDRTKEKELKPISIIDYLYFGGVISIVIFLYITPETFGVSLMEEIMKTDIPEWGLLHFIAFAFTAILTVRMFTVVNASNKTPAGNYMKSISIPFLVFLIITTFNHLISLLTTSWEVIAIDNEVIELSEQIFWLIGAFVLAFGYYNLNFNVQKSFSTKTTPDMVNADISSSDEIPDNGTVRLIIDVIANHIGSLAPKITRQSSIDSGIKLVDVNSTNIKQFADAVKDNTSSLIGEFPSKFLRVSLQKSFQNV